MGLRRLGCLRGRLRVARGVIEILVLDVDILLGLNDVMAGSAPAALRWLQLGVLLDVFGEQRGSWAPAASLADDSHV